jgi:hypothetical protein
MHKSSQNTTKKRLPDDSGQSIKKPCANACESRSVAGLPESEAIGATGSGWG